MSDGSRWYFPVFEGLFAAKHVEQMGSAIWLYGWILARAHVAQSHGLLRYNHFEAAESLGRDARQIRRWFNSLQQYGYLTTRARHAYHLEVEVTNWRSIEEWIEARTPEEMGHICPDRTPDRTVDRTPTSALSISIKLLSYLTLSGCDCAQPAPPETLSQAFAGWLEVLKTGRNKPAILQALYALCFGGDLPEYGYLGRVAKTIGGAGRLAEVMWQLTAKPPTGDVLAYILAMHRQQSQKNRGNGHRAEVMREIPQELLELNRIQGVGA